jgi:hypothetical protein
MKIKSIINWDLWQKIKGKGFKIEKEYLHLKRKNSMKTLKICLGVGLDQLFPEYTVIQISDSIDSNKKIERLESPCKFDHNGECLICDCWPENCAYPRFLNKDYSQESQQELEKMFKK